MRRLLLTCLIASFAGLLAAQPTPRASTKTDVKKTLVPAATKQRTNSTNTKRTPSFRTDANSGAARAAQPAATDVPAGTNTATRQNSNNAAQQNTTARTISGGVKKAAKLDDVNPVRVKWMTLEEALEKSKTDKRKIFVDVFTDWCGWCKRMDSTTFINPAVAQYLNDHYYPVKFNAEQQNEVVFKDKTYNFKKNGARGYHELAAEWLNNRLSYPTVVFLDENQGLIQPLPGYQDAAKMEVILNYFGTDSHKKTPWEAYQKKFNSGGDDQR